VNGLVRRHTQGDGVHITLRGGRFERAAALVPCAAIGRRGSVSACRPRPVVGAHRRRRRGRLSGWSRTDRGAQRPDACSPRKVMQVLTPWATSLPPDITSHSRRGRCVRALHAPSRLQPPPPTPVGGNSISPRGWYRIVLAQVGPKAQPMARRIGEDTSLHRAHGIRERRAVASEDTGHRRPRRTRAAIRSAWLRGLGSFPRAPCSACCPASWPSILSSVVVADHGRRGRIVLGGGLWYSSASTEATAALELSNQDP
jgi:hypothetical protein